MVTFVDVLHLMFSFGMFILALISVVIAIIKLDHKK
ncbi:MULTISPECIES: putative holin-like toxin [Mammaliicoccus]|nr:putative holin-like toxin [Mammaliicoccus lentus]MCD2521280.1 putative holin-like toxin [Mammaliicoccus lentus]WGZ42735.1 putative holin-like toxin [Mammaliicoccus lentus]WQL55646.1 putative holin-like toxin [Mammaliicoccus lentus]